LFAKIVSSFYKQSGIHVFPPHRDPNGPCLLRQIVAKHPWRGAVSWKPGFEAGILHRLDFYTSGAILAADSENDFEELRSLFISRRLEKFYVFEASFAPHWRTMTCSNEIAHHKRDRRRMVAKINDTTEKRGKWYEAKTIFHAEQKYILAIMRTGVMHQIRCHAEHCGIPLLGDILYFGSETDDSAYRLHHLGLRTKSWLSEPIPLPSWAQNHHVRNLLIRTDVRDHFQDELLDR